MYRDRLLLLAFALSGAAALGYELLWTRLLAVALGNETLGVLGVLGGFFGGLALGAWILHKRARQCRNPARLFAVLETIAALYALASPHLLYWLASRLPPLLGPAAGNNDTFLALVLSLAVSGAALLPGTFCMGGTIAALVEARRRVFRDDVAGHGLGRLYAANTLGATIGVLGSVYLVLPSLGMAAGSVALSSLGLAAAGIALLWSRGVCSLEDAQAANVAEPEQAAPPAVRYVYVLLFFTGLAGVGLEVAGIQILAQNFEDTVYTFANVLAVYLFGTAIGAWLYASTMSRLRGRPPRATAALLLFALALSVAVAGFVLGISGPLLDLLAPPDASYARDIAAELIVSAAVFLLPTMLMGALFSHLAALVESRGVGRAYAFNTLGGALAPFVFGVWAIRELGYAWSLYLAGVAYVLLFLSVAGANAWRSPRQLGAAALGLAALLAAPGSLVLVPAPQGFDVIARHQSLMGLVTVSEQRGGPSSGPLLNRRLQVNRHFRMGGNLSFGEQRMGHIPLLLAAEPRTALFLGVGTGATLSAVRHYPLERVDAVELVPEIIRTLPYFDHVNDRVYLSSNVRLHAADARRYLAASPERFDVIVADLFHPARDGAGALYSLEHFRQVRAHLAEGGLFAQWIPLHQFDANTLRTVVRTFLAVFPEVHSFLGLYSASTPPLVLIGRVPAGPEDALAIDFEALRQSLADPVYERLLMQDPRDLLASYLLNREALAAFAGDGPLNTDLNPRVMFDAPRSAYSDNPAMAYASLAELLDRRSLLPGALVSGLNDLQSEAIRSDVARYSSALGIYMQAEIARVRAGEPLPLPREIIDDYLIAYEVAPGFRAAAGMLYAAAAQDPEVAARILPRMLARAPDDKRTYWYYLRHLAHIGDWKRHAALSDEMRERFGTESTE